MNRNLFQRFIYSLCVASVSSIQCAGAESPTSLSTTFICNYATVSLKAGKRATLHAGPNSESKIVARLPNDTPIYTCNENGGWVKVYFGGACEEHFANGMSVKEVRKCRMAWIKDDEMIVHSG